jgi:urease accessory protein
MRHSFRSIALLLAGALASGTAMAHVGVHSSSAGGLAAGFAHPFIGLDHLLAMVAVGLWAVQLGGRFLFAVPATFVSFMAAGAAMGAAGIFLPQVEGVIALSVLALGIVVGLSAQVAWHWAVPLVAAFAVFHGHAHGAEMPEFGAPWLYFAGFLLATSILHAGGITGGVALRTHPGMLRLGGAAIGLAGAWLVISGFAIEL